ncbi:MAG: transporter, partial [Desulfuromonadales bacterium]|nr:transporter [Desulfuromonadales bacterium]
MNIFAHLYRFFAARRWQLFAATLALVAAGIFGFSQLRLEENVAALLPDGRSQVATDFALLDQAPFARKVLISLAAEPSTDTAELLAAADALAAALGPPWFSRAATGPGELDAGRFLLWLNDALPNLITPEELAAWGAGLDARGIDEQLQEARERLLLPEGWGAKELLRRDPLGLHRLGLAKLRHLNLVPQARLEDGHFIGSDGRHALVIADTPVVVTDSGGGAQMLRQLEQALALLPAGVQATVVSGHRYAAANAEVIRRDLAVTLSASALALLLLFALFLRQWRAIFPLLVPLAVVCLAASAVGLLYGTVSAMTLGFGAVLLGISVDFALHVYFALRRGEGEAAAIIAAVARPVLYGGLTTIAAFAVLLGSELPGQRQLAVFAISGLLLALLLSLLVLPHLIPPAPAAAAPLPAAGFGSRFSRRWVLGVWGVLLLGLLWPATGVRIDGDLRRLSLVPAELQTAEAELQENWGNLRGKALAFAEGGDLQQALAANDRLFAFLQAQQPESAVTLASV